MALETYRQKRKFDTTPEPRGGTRKKRAAGNGFVVQKHDATRLHYDFRLEMDGVLKSWAVTRGPSLVPGEKRLAVHVEDHPLEYGDFEGTIPKGEYGGGTVIVWDRGAWIPVFDAARGYRKGHLEFELKGEKLAGRWHLIRMAKKPREKRENWLLIKAEDAFARTENDPDILEEKPDSVKTGRGLAAVEDEAPGWSSKTGRIEPDEPPKTPLAKGSKARKPANAGAKETAAVESGKAIKGARKAAFIGFTPPALAVLKPTAPAGARWIHEIKFDGYRLQALLRDGKVELLTRGGLDWTQKFGEAVSAAIAALPASEAIIDGELVVETANGASHFSSLQADLGEGRSDRFVFYAFDLLYLDGYDFREARLIDRKTALETLLRGTAAELRFSSHFTEDGDMILRHACRLSLEGVVSKLRDGKYVSGRGKGWIKSKCSDRQEFVIAGYVPSSTSDKAIGSLVLGHYEDGELVHAGRVGTGFSAAVAADLFKRLAAIGRDTSPFGARLDAEARRGVRFVEPEFVAEVEFRNWTADGILRHAAFRGLREDKPAMEIVREDTRTSSPAAKLPDTVKLTHPDRVYWSDAGVTKEGLANYYAEVWPRMAPFVVGRPLSLMRCPGGVDGHCFFQKHAWKGQSKEILTFQDPNDSSDEPILAVDSFDGLIGLVQGGVLEIHPWGSTLVELEKPDTIIMDLDPGPGVEWTEVIAAAREVRQRLESFGLTGFVKNSGGKGLHIVAPVKPSAGWETVKQFTRDMADAMAADSPERFVSTVTKSKRNGKILVDYLRNGRGQTAVAPYSSRSRAGAPVSMPLEWSELDPGIGPAYFTVNNAPARIANLKSDPWGDFRKAEAPIKEAGKSGKSKRAR